MDLVMYFIMFCRWNLYSITLTQNLKKCTKPVPGGHRRYLQHKIKIQDKDIKDKRNVYLSIDIGIQATHV